VAFTYTSRNIVLGAQTYGFTGASAQLTWVQVGQTGVIEIVPVYYAAGFDNVVPIEVVGAKGIGVVPVRVGVKGPNVVPVRNAPTEVPRVKVVLS